MSASRATGIVRRIDELGRIVIPKEIRKTMRIRQMDSIEIYTAGDGEIVLKKYTPMGVIGREVSEYAQALYKITGNTVIITDRENVAACAGGGRELEYLPISRELRAFLENRTVGLVTPSDGVAVCENGALKDAHKIICPVISGGDLTGSVIMTGKDANVKLSDADEKMTRLTAKFLEVFYN